MDRTTAGDLENIPVAEGIVGHQWTSMGTDFNKLKFHNGAKDADYNFDPALDEDIIVSKANQAKAELTRNKKYMPEIDGFKFADATPKPFY